MNLYKHYKEEFPKLETNNFFNGYLGKMSLKKTKQNNYTNSQWLLFNKFIPKDLKELLDKEYSKLKNIPRIHSELTIKNALKEEDYECEGLIITQNNLLLEEIKKDCIVVTNKGREFMCYNFYLLFLLKYYPELVLGITKNKWITYLIENDEFVGIMTNCREVVRGY